MEARSGQNYLINFLPCTFNFMSFVFNSTVERINFMTCISNFLIRQINFMLHAFNFMACGVNFMLDILYSYLAGCCPILNTYRTRQSPTSSLLHPDKVILGQATLSPILFCTGAMNWMLDEVKSNKCFIMPKKSDQIG